MEKTRFEKKFLIDYASYVGIRAAVCQALEPDEFTGSQSAYPILSAYYDNESMEFYRQKIEGEFDHVKIRLRTYSPSLLTPGKFFLEAKIKHNNNQYKVRIPLDPKTKEECRQVLRPSFWASLEDKGVDVIGESLFSTNLFHVCSVYYEREVYDGMIGSDRIRFNFDTHLTSLMPGEFTATKELIASRNPLEYFAIMEIKCEKSELPKAVLELLTMYSVHETRVSKYSESINLIHENYGGIITYGI